MLIEILAGSCLEPKGTIGHPIANGLIQARIDERVVVQAVLDASMLKSDKTWLTKFSSSKHGRQSLTRALSRI